MGAWHVEGGAESLGATRSPSTRRVNVAQGRTVVPTSQDQGRRAEPITRLGRNVFERDRSDVGVFTERHRHRIAVLEAARRIDVVRMVLVPLVLPDAALAGAELKPLILVRQPRKTKVAV